MKRKFTLACVLACALGMGGLSACGGEKYDYKLTVWAAEAAKALTESQATEWAAAIKESDGKTVKITVSAVGEGDAASSMINDVEAGADVFCFAQDQLARLRSAGALTEIVDANLKASLKAANDEMSYSAATIGNDNLVAFPLTSDNGFFMYYDASLFTDTSKLRNMSDIIEVCKAAGRKIYFNNTSAWYNAAYFFGAGCVSEWEINDAGLFTGYNDTYNSAKGVKAMKALYELVGTNKDLVIDSASSSEAFGKDASGKIVAGVCISGTWDAAVVKIALGSNLGAIKLPQVTVGEESFELASFKGCKLMGVKPQKDSTKAAYAQNLAKYLTGEAKQLERYKTLGWGPSNLVAQQDSEVKADPILKALYEQNAKETTVIQGQYPGDWWTTAGNLAESLAATDGSESKIKALLKGYEATISSYVNG